MEYKDYYKILGIKKDVNQDDIKKAYRKLAKKYHPDLNPNDKEAERRFKEINEAYQVLNDEEKRKKYDMFGSNFDFQNGSSFDPSQYGWSGRTYKTSNGEGFSDFFNMFFGEDGFDLDSILRGFTSGKGGFNSYYSHSPFDRHGQSRQRAEKDIEVDIDVYIGMALNGGDRVLSLRPSDGSIKRLKIKIPKGIIDGEKIRLRGQGVNGGDLIITVHVKDDEKHELKGIDIIQNIPITPWEGALGSSVTVKTLEGERISVKIPKCISSGQRLRIAGKGFRDRKGNRGDLYIRIQIVLPDRITDREKQLYTELKKISDWNPRGDN